MPPKESMANTPAAADERKPNAKSDWPAVRRVESRDSVVYFRNGTRERGYRSFEMEPPRWRVELEAASLPPSTPSEPVVYFRNGAKGKHRRGV